MTHYTAQIRTVYFIRPVGKLGPVKIGCTSRLDARRQQLQGAGDPLEVAASLAGSMDDEMRIHSLFWHAHRGGEWFEWSPLLQLLIDAVNRGEADLSALPPKRVRPMLHLRGRKWTEDQKLRAKYGRLIRKAEKASGKSFPHLISHHDVRETWKGLIPEIERFLEAAA